MTTIKERLTTIELKVKGLTKAVYILSAVTLGIKVVPDAWPPILNFFQSLA